jgi:phosphopantetheinyl transferase (holo-ACP synthase)
MTSPDETTILKFRRFLEQHGLAVKILGAVNAHLTEKGLLLREGTIVDATIIQAPSSTKNRDKQRDPDMHQTRKGQQWYFGMKAHIGVDRESGLVHIDIEHVAGEDTSAALKATVVNLEELAYLETLVGLLPLSASLTTVFSAKESLFKSAFSAVGRYFDFSATRVVRLDMERGVLSLELTETLCDTFFLQRVCNIGFCFIDRNIVLTYFVW